MNFVGDATPNAWSKRTEGVAAGAADEQLASRVPGSPPNRPVGRIFERSKSALKVISSAVTSSVR